MDEASLTETLVLLREVILPWVITGDINVGASEDDNPDTSGPTLLPVWTDGEREDDPSGPADTETWVSDGGD
jgi:hypothetical protein